MVGEVVIYNDEPRCGTFAIAQGFEREHFKVLRLIEKHKDRFLRLENKRLLKSLIIQRVPSKKAGRPTDEILLNETQFIFLGTLFRNTEKVLDFKEKLANDFVKNRKQLLLQASTRQSQEWIENRASGKLIRREETDTIRDFVEYAKIQGSKNAEKYYVALSACVNRNMFNIEGKFKNVREMMTPGQLMDAKFSDKIVSRGLIEGISKGLHYKEIYQLVKGRLIAFAEIYGKSDIVAKQLQIDDDPESSKPITDANFGTEGS